MWPTEYMLHEHRKDLLREAAQIGLARQARMPHRSLLSAVFSLINFRRLSRPRLVEMTEAAPCPQTVVMGRVN